MSLCPKGDEGPTSRATELRPSSFTEVSRVKRHEPELAGRVSLHPL